MNSSVEPNYNFVVTGPRLLVMGEPFSSIDSLTRHELIEGLLANIDGASILISSHDLGEVERFFDSFPVGGPFRAMAFNFLEHLLIVTTLGRGNQRDSVCKLSKLLRVSALAASNTAENEDNPIAFDLLHATLLAYERRHAPEAERETIYRRQPRHPERDSAICSPTLPAKLD